MTISSVYLAYVRNRVTSVLTSTCDIKNLSTETTTSYRPQTAYNLVAGNVACRVLPTSSGSTTDAMVYGDRQIVGEAYEIALPYGTTVKTGYVIEVDNEVYTVVSIEDIHTDKAFVTVIAIKP